ncbi:MAG TPA: hypothetical protein VFV85_09515 [Conexibacter sp.]|nr:hypothetical protein [Conexibacter sp.]
MRRALPLALVTLVAAGCGSQRAPGGAAAYAPPDAQAFIAFRTDANWQPFARFVLGRVPRVAKDAHQAAFALVRGRVVAVPTTGTRPARALADDARYRAALEAVPHGARGVAYVRGDVAAARLQGIPGFVVAVPTTLRRRGQSIGPLRFHWGAAWLTKDGVGARLSSVRATRAETDAQSAVEQVAQPYAPALFDEIPADAQFVLDLHLAQSSFTVMPKLPAQIAALFSGDLIGVPGELDEVMQGETALYTRAGGELTLVTQPSDTLTARKALGELTASLKAARSLHVATIGGQFVASTSAAGIDAFRGGGPKLSAGVELPGQVTAVVYAAHRYIAWGGLQGSDPTFTVRFSR